MRKLKIGNMLLVMTGGFMSLTNTNQFPRLSRDKLIEHNLRYQRYAYTNIPIESNTRISVLSRLLILRVDSSSSAMLSGGLGKLSWRMSKIPQLVCLSTSGELLIQNIESSKSQKDEFLYDSCVPRKVGFEDWMVGSYEEEKRDYVHF